MAAREQPVDGLVLEAREQLRAGRGPGKWGEAAGIGMGIGRSGKDRHGGLRWALALALLIADKHVLSSLRKGHGDLELVFFFSFSPSLSLGVW